MRGLRRRLHMRLFSSRKRLGLPERLEKDWLHRNLTLLEDHPLNRVKRRIWGYFSDLEGDFEFHDQGELSPFVSTDDNFDSLLIPEDHVSRASTDTYYVDDTTVLRTHMTAHQTQLLSKMEGGTGAWMACGDVYRRDTIDRTHFPAFHQIDGARVFPEKTEDRYVEDDMKGALEGLSRHLFGPELQLRWVDEYFPFTHPSWELEILFHGEWLEVLGCGVIRREILAANGLGGRTGWAFGMGLERLAMVLYDIKDIRLFWSRDERLLKPFKNQPLEADIAFKPFSKFPKSNRDVSFWYDQESGYHENLVYELVREVAGDLVEDVAKTDDFVHTKTGRSSNTFRITYRSMERNLISEEVNELQERVRNKLVADMGVELR